VAKIPKNTAAILKEFGNIPHYSIYYTDDNGKDLTIGFIIDIENAMYISGVLVTF